MFFVQLSPAVAGQDYAETIELSDADSGDRISRVVLDQMTIAITVRPFRDSGLMIGNGSASVVDDGLVIIAIPGALLRDVDDAGVRVTLDFSSEASGARVSGRLLEAVLPVVRA